MPHGPSFPCFCGLFPGAELLLRDALRLLLGNRHHLAPLGAKGTFHRAARYQNLTIGAIRGQRALSPRVTGGFEAGNDGLRGREERRRDCSIIGTVLGLRCSLDRQRHEASEAVVDEQASPKDISPD